MNSKKRMLFAIGIIVVLFAAALLFRVLFTAFYTIGDPGKPSASEQTVPSEAPETSESSEVSAAFKLPVLMYHHISDDVTSSAVVTAETFETHMAALKEAGFSPVSLKELVNFVYNGGELPEKPVVITFDDGYMSNYETAFPILRKYDMKASVFIIGSSVGKSTYKDTGHPIIPHFGYEEANEMISSGLIEIQSHFYDMHQSRQLESGVARTTAAQLEGESDEEYIKALRSDIVRSINEIEDNTGEECFAFSYPLGVYNKTSESILMDEGAKITFTTEARLNEINRGDPQCLFLLGRYGISNDITAEALIDLCGY